MFEVVGAPDSGLTLGVRVCVYVSREIVRGADDLRAIVLNADDAAASHVRRL